MLRCKNCKDMLAVVPFGCLCPTCDRFYYPLEIRNMEGFSQAWLDREMIRFATVMSFFLANLGLAEITMRSIEYQLEKKCREF